MKNEKRTFEERTIKELVEMSNNSFLKTDTRFQRNSGLWKGKAQTELIDSILCDMPIPLIIVTRSGEDNWKVIDGQQRITTILGFIKGKFSLQKRYLSSSQEKLFEEKQCKFTDLLESIQNDIWDYKIYADVLLGYQYKQLREIFIRINRNSLKVNPQELRKVDYYDSASFDLSKTLAQKMAKRLTVFSKDQQKRMKDIEVVSLLLLLIIKGTAQEQAIGLEDFYKDYKKWDETDRDKTKDKFMKVVTDLVAIFSGTKTSICIEKTRYNHISDFYSLFDAIFTLHNEGYELGNNVASLRENLKEFHENVKTDAPGEYGKYSMACSGTPNSRFQRITRKDILYGRLKKFYHQPH